MSVGPRLSDKAVVTHVVVVVRDGDAGGQVAMPLAEFAKLFAPIVEPYERPYLDVTPNGPVAK